MVLEILAAAEAEIDAAVDEAYAEGYKAASLRFVPEIEGLKVQLNALPVQKKLSSVKDRLLFGFGGFALGALSVGIYNLVPK
jgi:predicted exporter